MEENSEKKEENTEAVIAQGVGNHAIVPVDGAVAVPAVVVLWALCCPTPLPLPAVAEKKRRRRRNPRSQMVTWDLACLVKFLFPTNKIFLCKINNK